VLTVDGSEPAEEELHRRLDVIEAELVELIERVLAHIARRLLRPS
jgi:hypothetical protein